MGSVRLFTFVTGAVALAFVVVGDHPAFFLSAALSLSGFVVCCVLDCREKTGEK